MKKIIITLLALATAGGVASADRRHEGPAVRDHRSGGVFVQPSRSYNNSYNRGGYDHGSYQGRTYVQPRSSGWHGSVRFSTPSVGIRYVRRPIYVQRPEIRYRYYNQYQRPTVIVENYPARDGYIWVAGQWQWSGYEWMWQPGHYEPDPSYQSPYYNSDGTYYDNSATGTYYDYDDGSYNGY